MFSHDVSLRKVNECQQLTLNYNHKIRGSVNTPTVYSGFLAKGITSVQAAR